MDSKQEQFTVANQTNSTRNELHQAIKSNNLTLLKQLFKTHNVVPHEEISTQGHYWTCIHYACHFGWSDILEFLLKKTYAIYKDDFSKIVNSKSSDGWNPLMIATIYDSDKCVNALLKYGGIKLYDKDNNGQDACALAEKYVRHKIQKTLSQQAARYRSQAKADPSKFLTPVNLDLLANQDAPQDNSNLAKPHLANPENKVSQQETFNTRKNQIHQAIKSGDLAFLKQLMDIYKIAPNEEISTTGNFWSSIHYACHFGSCIILDYLLKKTYAIYKDEFSNVLNSKTVEGWNPLMISCLYGTDSCLNMLLKYGGVKLYDKDKTGLRAVDLAKKYGQENAFKILTQQAALFPPKVIVEPSEFATPVNVECLASQEELKNKSNLTKIEDRDEYQHLLRYGERLPCVMCQGVSGWIKYLECCGNPIHPLCAKEVKICTCCGNKALRLSSNVKDPEKSFVIHPTEEILQLAIK